VTKQLADFKMNPQNLIFVHSELGFLCFFFTLSYQWFRDLLKQCISPQ